MARAQLECWGGEGIVELVLLLVSGRETVVRALRVESGARWAAAVLGGLLLRQVGWDVAVAVVLTMTVELMVGEVGVAVVLVLIG